MPLPRLTTTSAVLTVGVIACIIRLLALALPLVIGNDGVGYLHWAQQIIAGEPIRWPPFRTPGYSCFLAGILYILGPSSLAVVAIQQFLGLACAMLIAWAASRLVRPWLGLLAGLFAAFDPVYLALASQAMTEMLATFLLLLSACIIIFRLTSARRWTLFTAAALGLTLGALVLVRPAFQIVIPFLALALLACEAPRRWRMALSALLMAATMFAVTGPWLYYNAQRGIRGLSTGNSLFLWVGLNYQNLLSRDYPLPPELRDRYESTVGPTHDSQAATHAFLGQIHAWHDPPTRRLLVNWALSSIAANPTGYLRGLPRALGWQLDYFPRQYNEMVWVMQIPSLDGRNSGQHAANFCFDGSPSQVLAFAAEPGRGPVAAYLRWAGDFGGTAAIRIPLFVAAVAAMLVAAFRRRWALALLMAATLAYLGVHVLFLLFHSRFSAPCWMVWYLAPATLAGAWRPAGVIRGLGPLPSGKAAEPVDPARRG